ncbi:MAG TPA: hypothetical protein VKB59_13735 [Micromonosporaceae bacterium]|nr:hypothetical protein [Micromonosporaceae bacterium]
MAVFLAPAGSLAAGTGFGQDISRPLLALLHAAVLAWRPWLAAELAPLAGLGLALGLGLGLGPGVGDAANAVPVDKVAVSAATASTNAASRAPRRFVAD